MNISTAWAPTQAPPAPRLMHVLFHLDVGGVEMGVVNLARGLLAEGYAQAVCCLERPGALSSRLPPQVPLYVCADEPASRWRPLLRAAAHMRDFRPNIVHARNDGAWRYAAAAWLLAACPGRLVFSIHGRGREDGGRSWLAALRYRLLAAVTRSMAAVSHTTAREFAASSGIAAARIEVLHTGIDTDLFRPNDGPGWHPGLGRPFVIGCIARMDGLKGHDTLLRAFATLYRQAPGAVLLRLVGDGPCRNQLQAQAAALGVTDAVHFVGERSDVQRQLQGFDIFVLASLQEGRPTSIMEALCTGLPVVATRVGAVAELLGKEEVGLMVEPDDPVALAAAINTLIADGERRLRMATAARRMALDQLSMNRMVRQYDAFYTSALS